MIVLFDEKDCMWKVGCFAPTGKFYEYDSFTDQSKAGIICNWLNGGDG